MVKYGVAPLTLTQADLDSAISEMAHTIPYTLHQEFTV